MPLVQTEGEGVSRQAAVAAASPEATSAGASRQAPVAAASPEASAQAPAAPVKISKAKEPAKAKPPAQPKAKQGKKKSTEAKYYYSATVGLLQVRLPEVKQDFKVKNPCISLAAHKKWETAERIAYDICERYNREIRRWLQAL